jgi:hypothetical protein
VTESINTCVAVCDGEVFVAFVLTSTVTAYNPAGVRLTVGPSDGAARRATRAVSLKCLVIGRPRAQVGADESAVRPASPSGTSCVRDMW